MSQKAVSHFESGLHMLNSYIVADSMKLGRLHSELKTETEEPFSPKQPTHIWCQIQEGKKNLTFSLLVHTPVSHAG